jgi:hypothetical protein
VTFTLLLTCFDLPWHNNKVHDNLKPGGKTHVQAAVTILTSKRVQTTFLVELVPTSQKTRHVSITKNRQLAGLK